MSLLRAWWGGSTQDDEGKKSPAGGEDNAEGEGSEKPEETTNSWVKGFGGEPVPASPCRWIMLLWVLLDIVSSVSGYASNIKETVSTTAAAAVQRTVSVCVRVCGGGG